MQNLGLDSVEGVLEPSKSQEDVLQLLKNYTGLTASSVTTTPVLREVSAEPQCCVAEDLCSYVHWPAQIKDTNAGVELRHPAESFQMQPKMPRLLQYSSPSSFSVGSLPSFEPPVEYETRHFQHEESPILHGISSVSHHSRPLAQKFPTHAISNMKYVLYNLMVDAYNNNSADGFLHCFTVKDGDVVKNGFRFNIAMDPGSRLAELYALYIRKKRLDLEDKRNAFTQDLYKYYKRSCVDMLCKYFEKKDKWTFLYMGEALFQPGDTLEVAQDRIKRLQVRRSSNGGKKRNRKESQDFTDECL